MAEWHTAFRVLAHEIRSPVGVIAGCVRMLGSGRLDEAGRAEVLVTMDRATERLAGFGHQASELARWLEPGAAGTGSPLEIQKIVTDALSAAGSPERVDALLDRQGGNPRVRVSDRRALAGALAAMIDATVREVEQQDGRVAVTTRHPRGADWCDVLIGPPAQVSGLGDVPTLADTMPFDLDRGGMGLQLILSATIFDAHGAQPWSLGARRSVTGVRFPVDTEE